MHKVLIIIPAYNEEEAICNTIANIKKNVEGSDIVVINDGSKDSTFFKARSMNVKVIDLPFNLGIGGAMQTGYLYAYQNNYDVAVQIDADGQHNSMYVNDIIKELKDCDMVIGSRYLKKTSYKSTFLRRLGMIYFSFLISFFCRKKITDTTSGFRAVNKSVIKFFAANYPSDYPEVEVIIRLNKNKCKIKEVSVEMEERKNGKSFVTPIKSIYYMVKVTFGVIISAIRNKKYYI